MTAAASPSRLVTFRLGEHLFAADIAAVERVLRTEGIRAIPDMPEWMEGVIDHAGAVVPVIDLRKRFGLPAGGSGSQARLVVCNGNGVQAALRVDAVLDVRPVSPDEVTDPPALFRGLAGACLRGLTRRQGELVVMLDLDRLLSTTEPLVLDPGGARPASG